MARLSVWAFGCARLAAFEILGDDPDNYDARATMLWASFVETSGMLGLSMEERWTYSIFSAAGLLRFTLGTVYRENLAMILPRWLVFAARHHPEAVCRFAEEVLGAPVADDTDATVRFAYERLMDIVRAGGLPATLDAYGAMPSFDEVEAATHRVSSKEFTVQEYYAMVQACGSEAYPGLE